MRAVVTPRRHLWTPGPIPGVAREATDPVVDRAAAIKFVEERGYEPVIAEGVVKALSKPEWGSNAGGLLTLATRLAGRWEVGEDAGLHSLAKAIEREMAVRTGRELVKFQVVPSRGPAFECEALEGMSLKDVAEFGDGPGAELLGEHLECACAGVMACSTCHVQVDDAWLAAVGEATEAEEDMLDLAYGRSDASRLGCQLVLAPALRGLVVHIPGGVNNMMDHIPFEDAARAVAPRVPFDDTQTSAGEVPAGR